MNIVDHLKRRQTRHLLALVRKVRREQRLHRYVRSEDQFLASSALAIIKQRRRRK